MNRRDALRYSLSAGFSALAYPVFSETKTVQADSLLVPAIGLLARLVISKPLMWRNRLVWMVYR